MSPVLQWGGGEIITYSECVLVALGIQHAIRVSRIILLSVACSVLHYDPVHYLINGKIFGEVY